MNYADDNDGVEELTIEIINFIKDRLNEKIQSDKINTIASMAATIWSTPDVVYNGIDVAGVALDLYDRVETRVKNEAKDE